jgi:uncharacterized protein YggU (UPF0235/DUF167 family)
MDAFFEKSSVDILVKTNTKKTLIKKYDEKLDLYYVDVSEIPENNKANIKIINYFSKLSGKKVRIIKGLKSNKKTLKFE